MAKKSRNTFKTIQGITLSAVLAGTQLLECGIAAAKESQLEFTGTTQIATIDVFP